MTDVQATICPDSADPALLPALATALDGGAPVILGDPPTRPVPPGTALVLRTSGSHTGLGRPVALSANALLASADATHAFLGGPGQWFATLPATHVGGLQILIRALRAGISPVLVPRADPHGLVTAIAAAGAAAHPHPRYLSLVPTQLHRALEDPEATAALATCRALLIGGAGTPPDLLARARERGLNAVTTYGMTETAGGCVYDGKPLPGVEIRIDDDGRILLRGPILAEGYLDDGPQPFVEADGTRWLRTNDIGELDPTGRLRVLGRADDVLITGGVNVHPAQVERALRAGLAADGAPDTDILVVGVPDPEWGTLVTAVVTTPIPLVRLREVVGGGPAAPRAVVHLQAIPARGIGKPDRRAAAAAARRLLSERQGERLGS